MRERLCPEAEDLRPEDRRRAEALVEPEAPVGQLEALVGPALRRDRHALDDEAARVPDGVFALGGDPDDPPGLLAGRVDPAAPQVEHRGVEDRVRERVRVAKPLGERDRRRRSPLGGVRVAAHPQEERPDRVRDDDRVRPDPQRATTVPVGVEQRDRAVELRDAPRDVAHERRRRAEDHEALDAHAVVALGVGDGEDVTPDARHLVHVADLEVEVREAAQDRHLMRHAAGRRRDRERVPVQVLDPGRVALDREEQARQRQPQRDGLVGRLARPRRPT